MGKYLPDLQYDKDLRSYVCNKPQKINIDTLLKLTQNNNLKDTALLACCHHQIGVFYFGKEEYLSSIKHNELAINLRRSFDDGLLWKSLRNLGTCYENFQRYDKMTMYYEEALTYYQPNDKSKVIMLKNFAQALAKIGDISRAENEILQAINISNNENINENEIAKVHSMMAEIILNTVDSLNIKEAIYHAKKAIKLSEKRKTKIAALNELGRAYDLSGFYEDAITQYEKVLSYSDNMLVQSKAKNNIAAAYEKLGNYKMAINLFIESIKLKFDYHKQKKHHFDYAINHRNLGENYFALQQYDTALLHYQKGLINLTDKFRSNDIFQNPNPKDTSVYVFSNPEMVQILHLKATAAYKHYQQNNNPKYLNLGHQTYQTLIDFHNKLQQDITTENSRLYQSKNILEYLEQALEIAYTKQTKHDFDAEAIFRLMEKNKATVLLQSMNEADALQFADLPDRFLEQEKELKYAIAYYERLLINAKAKEDTITVIKELENTLFENKEEYHRLIKILEENFPDYYQLKYQQNQLTIADVQNTLDAKTALLEYFVGDSAIYILSIQKEASQLYELPKPKNWQPILDDFRLALTDSLLLRDGIDRYKTVFVESGHQLYQWLLEEPLNDLETPIDRLQIIPDGALNFIPFELLLTEKVDSHSIDYRKLPYVLRNKSLGYLYAGTFLKDQKKAVSNDTLLSLAGFSANYQHTSLGALPFSETCVRQLSKKFEGTAFTNAIKQNFMEEAAKYKTLLFAMHAKLDDKNAMNSALIFSPTSDSLGNQLRAADLYNTSLNAEMAVLSACETGLGKINKGEGVMSLSRAFTYAGCPSLVMSLWSIPNKSTTKLTESFFDNLNDGMTKDRALQQTKLAYLDTIPSRLAHPIYWAGLVATGDLSPVDLVGQSSWFLYWVVILLLVFGLGLFYYFYRKQKDYSLNV